MSKATAYVEKREAELQEYKAQLDGLKARAKQQIAEGKLKGYDELDRLEQKRDEVTRKLKELSQAGEERWEELKNRCETAWDEFTQTAKAVQAKLK